MSEDAHEFIIALKLNLLEELQPEQVNSDRTASNHPYDRELHCQCKHFGIYSAQERLHRQLRAQNAVMLHQETNTSVKSC